MPREFSRTERVADFLKRELALLIQREVKDPRLTMTNINDVEVSRDLSHAKVFFTLVGNDSDTEGKEAEGVLNRASGFLRKNLAQSSAMRSTPRIQFRYDKSVIRGQELSALIDKAVASDSSPASDEDSSDI